MKKFSPWASISSEDSMIAHENRDVDASSTSTRIQSSQRSSRKWYWPFRSGKDNNKQKVPIRKLFRFASKGDKWLIALAYFCSIISGILQPYSVLLFAIFIRQVTTSLEDGKLVSEAVMPMVLVFIYLGTANMVFGYFHNFLWILTGERQTRRIRQRYMHAILRQDMAWFDQSAQESLTARLAADTQAIQDGISEHYGNYVRIISSSFFGYILSFGLCYQVSGVVLATLPALGGVLLGSGYLVNKNLSKAQSASAAASAIAEQVFAGIRTVYAFSLQTRFSRLYESKLVTACYYGVRRAAFLGIGSGGFLFVLCSIFGVAFYYGGQLVEQEVVSGFRVMGGFFIIILGSITLLGLPAHYKFISSACATAYKVFQTIDRVPPIDPDSTEGIIPQRVTGRIEFRNIMFKYPTRPDVTILKNLSLDIEPGTTVAFVGASGSGKSTSIQLLQRFYDPLHGQVLLDGIDVRDLNLRWLREQIGVVSQEPVLFNMTVRQNLLMGLNRPATQEEIVTACQKANCHTFITKLPQGYDTVVGERGGMLSGGQKQRIAIARAILKNPTILLLDEATSALDTQSERLVQRALDAASANRTTIVIAHRLSTIRNADKIVVMHKGDLVEQGTHHELLARNGIYAELVRKQEVATEDQGEAHYEQVDLHEAQAQEKVLFEQYQDASVSEEDVSGPFQGVRPSDTYVSVASSVDAYEMKRLREKAELKQKRHQRTPIRKIISQLRPEWYLLAIGGCGALIAGAVKPCLGYVVMRTIFALMMPDEDDTSTSTNGSVSGANLWVLLFVVIGIGAFIGNCLMTGAFEIAGERYTQRFRAAIFHAFLRQEIGYFDHEENNLGALTSRLDIDSKNVHEVVTRVWADVLQMVSTVITGMVISFVYSWKMTLVVLVWSPFVVGATFYETKINSGFQDKTAKANELSGQVASEAIKEIRTVAALSKQEYFENKYGKATERPHRLAIRKAILSSISFALLQGIVLYAAGVSFYAGIKFIEQGGMDFTSLFVCLMCVLITLQGAGQASIFVSTYMKAKVSAITTFEVLERQTAIDPDLEGFELDSSNISGDISFENITFRYPARPDLSIFNGEFNLNGYSGQTIALVGPSGCGKSTCIGMLQRWYDPLSGIVRLDGQNVKGFSLGNLRSHMALVGQEPVLFNLTIGENIRFGVGEDVPVTQEQVEEAAKAANIHDFIVGLPQGYDTPVGDKGSQLSGGQKQRIAIARALIRKPKILLLDEATSALDSESEKLVQQALDNIISRGGRTTITIAHRLSTIQNADVIFVIKDGRVVERGSHFELLRLNGVYADLVREQSLTV